MGSDMARGTSVWAEPETEPLLQPWRGVGAGQGSMLEDNSTAGPLSSPRALPQETLHNAPRNSASVAISLPAASPAQVVN